MIQRFRNRAMSLALLSSLAFPAFADIPITKYDEVKDNETFQTFIQGVHDGIFIANLSLITNGQAPLYCPPMDRNLTRDEVLGLVATGVADLRSNARYQALPAQQQAMFGTGQALENALKKTYPCTGGPTAQIRQAVPAPQLPAPVPVYQPAPLPALPSVAPPSAPGRTSTMCRKLSNGTVVCS